MSKRWSSEVTIKFLEEYELNPCLWDVISNDYKNRECRETGYQNISKAMNIEGFDSSAVKAKIRSIRNAYTLERTKINKSKKSGSGTEDIYKSKLPWFPIADRILHEVVQIRESQSTEISENEESTQEESQSTSVDETEIMNEQEFEGSTSTVQLETPKRSTSNVLSKPELTRKPVILIPPKRGKIDKSSKSNATEKIIKDLREITQELNNPPNDNEFDCFGNTIASQLKQLPEALALESMAKIQSYMVQQRLEGINTRNYNQDNSQHSHSSFAHQYLVNNSQPQQKLNEDSKPRSSSYSSMYDQESTDSTNSQYTGDVLAEAVKSIIP